MKKRFVIITSIIFILSILFFFSLKEKKFDKTDEPTSEGLTTYPVMKQSALYTEYPFDSGDDKDLGFTYRALELLQKENTFLHTGSTAVEDTILLYVPLTERELAQGIVERRTWNNDIYELIHDRDSGISGIFQMRKNGQFLFEEEMDYGADGPIQDWRIVNGKPAFTFRSNDCATGENNTTICEQDIWYDGYLVSKKFDMKNPRYLFSYADTIGFVTSENDNDRIFYGQRFMSEPFDTIWTHNCCSYTEILPTVYENGILLFYAKRGEINYLVETSLE